MYGRTLASGSRSAARPTPVPDRTAPEVTSPCSCFGTWCCSLTHWALPDLGRAYALAGDTSQARDILRELEEAARAKPVSSVEVASVHAALDQKEQCFQWLDRAMTARDPYLLYLAVDQRFDRSRSDPRVQDMLRRMGFPAALIAAPPGGG